MSQSSQNMATQVFLDDDTQSKEVRTPHVLPKTHVTMAQDEINLMKRHISTIEQQVSYIPEIKQFINKQREAILKKDENI